MDGIHLGSLTKADLVDPLAPVVMTIPMVFNSPNFIVGDLLYDFLCLGCCYGFSNLRNLHLNHDGVISLYQTPRGGFFDERSKAILQTLSHELSLVPWPDVREHFETLQAEFMPLVTFFGERMTPAQEVWERYCMRKLQGPPPDRLLAVADCATGAAGLSIKS